MPKTNVQNLSWEEAIQQVLSAADGALHYAEIAERVAAQHLRKSVGATPAATVASILSRALADPATPYQRVGRGEYTLKAQLEQQSASPKGEQAQVTEDDETGALRSFGMFWQRELVVWSGQARLLGRQGLGATAVNFAEQVGVYLLHDRERVIYVGRAADTLYARLKSHTTDRMGGRWDRFSWFGLHSVGPDGTLTTTISPWTQDVVIETFEALLIESLEPPLNRKRGDNFSGAEYLQATDPSIEGSKRRKLLEELAKGAGISEA